MTETNKTLLNLGLTALVSAGTGLVVSELSKDSADRSASVGGSSIDSEALKAQIKESLYNDWLNDPIIQNRLRGAKGDKGDVGGDGQNGVDGEMLRVDGGENGSNFNYLRGIDTGNGVAYIKKNGNSSQATDLLVTVSRNDGTGVIRVWENGFSGVQLSGDGSAEKIGGGSFVALSDERLKENIEDFTNGLAKVIAIQTKSFNYKAVKGTRTEFYPPFICEKKHYGVIAQQLQDVCPEMVIEDKTGFLSVDLSNLNLMLINAVKELDKKDKAQQTIINQYKTRIETLETTVQGFLGRLEALEAPQA